VAHAAHRGTQRAGSPPSPSASSPARGEWRRRNLSYDHRNHAPPAHRRPRKEPGPAEHRSRSGRTTPGHLSPPRIRALYTPIPAWKCRSARVGERFRSGSV